MTDHPNNVTLDALRPDERQMVLAAHGRAIAVIDQLLAQRDELTTFALSVEADEVWQDFTAIQPPIPHELIADVLSRLVFLMHHQMVANFAAEQFGLHDAAIRLADGRMIHWCAAHEQLTATYVAHDGRALVHAMTPHMVLERI